MLAQPPVSRGLGASHVCVTADSPRTGVPLREPSEVADFARRPRSRARREEAGADGPLNTLFMPSAASFTFHLALSRHHSLEDHGGEVVLLLLVALRIGSFGFHGAAVDKIRLVILAAFVLLSVKRHEVRRERRRLLSEPVRKEPPKLEPVLRKPVVAYPQVRPATIPSGGGAATRREGLTEEEALARRRALFSSKPPSNSGVERAAELIAQARGGRDG